ncbi:hypothetical protein [Agromyces sp. ZXT2-6]|uniref:hypothetical protein n=1 Tax=Agromyces sp. ZXT2-6 TaxID=3461153 RepID=UPI004054D4D0
MLLGILFISVTALTLIVWVAGPEQAETNPALDLAFFALGVMVAAGFASQVRGRAPAGATQALVAAASLAAAGALALRIEPTVGGLVLTAAATVLVILRPRPRMRIDRHWGRIPLGIAAALSAVPAGLHVADMLTAARAAGPSCFLGRCAGGDRLAESAALAVAIVLLAAVAAVGVDGWPLCAWSAGLAAILLGSISLILPTQVGSIPSPTAVAAVAWGFAVVIVTGVSTRMRERAGS